MASLSNPHVKANSFLLWTSLSVAAHDNRMWNVQQANYLSVSCAVQSKLFYVHTCNNKTHRKKNYFNRTQFSWSCCAPMWTKINKCMLHKWLCWIIGVWVMSVLIASVHLDRSVENDIVHAWVQQTTMLQIMIRSSYCVRKVSERTFSHRSCSKFRHTPPASWVSMKPKCFHNKTFPDSSSPLAGFSTLEKKG